MVNSNKLVIRYKFYFSIKNGSKLEDFDNVLISINMDIFYFILYLHFFSIILILLRYEYIYVLNVKLIMLLLIRLRKSFLAKKIYNA